MGFVVDRIVPSFIWVFTVGAMVAGMAVILSKILPRMPNRASRFVVFLVLMVPLGSAYGYSKVWLLGRAKMSWTEHVTLALPGALLGATLFTLWSPLSRNSNTR